MSSSTESTSLMKNERHGFQDKSERKNIKTGHQHRMKLVSLSLVSLALIAVGVVLVAYASGAGMGVGHVGRSEWISSSSSSSDSVTYENANLPMKDLPEDVHVPEGWTVESDGPFGPGGQEWAEEGSPQLKQEQKLAEDDDIDSPLEVEQDGDGKEYIADVDEDVIVTGASAQDGTLQAVGEDVNPACFQNLNVCSFRKRCERSCRKKCRPVTERLCKAHKFCKCFCKHFKHIKKAKRCVVYKRKKCRQAKRYQCKRNCKKFCKKSPRCYCCPTRRVMKRCKRLCKKISYKTKCGKCRCYRLKCSNYCRFVCKAYKK